MRICAIEWSAELIRVGKDLQDQAWAGLGLNSSGSGIVLFNSLSFARSELVRVVAPAGVNRIVQAGVPLAAQLLQEDGLPVLYFVSPKLGAYGFAQLETVRETRPASVYEKLRASETELESPFYLLKIDPNTGGISSLVYKSSGTELVAEKNRATLGQTVFFDGKDHRLSSARSRVVAHGPVFARLSVSAEEAGVSVTCSITVYADLDRVDLDYHIRKPISSVEQRLIQVFSLLGDEAAVRSKRPGRSFARCSDQMATYCRERTSLVSLSRTSRMLPYPKARE